MTALNIFLLLILALAIILVMLRFKISIGPCMLAAGLFIWTFRSLSLDALSTALISTLTMPRTYDIILALYFVMCLEIELRVSGALHDMVAALRRKFSGVKVLLAIMPAFLGLLPSPGGARFSAPIVEELSQSISIDRNTKAAINFWFRHLFEFSSPIIPGMIIACSIAGVAFSDMLKHLSWVTVLAFAVGWFVLIRPIRAAEIVSSDRSNEHETRGMYLALGSVASIFALVIAFGLSASMGTAAIVLAMIFVLRLADRAVGVKEIFIGALDKKMFVDIGCILLFIQLLDVTNVLNEIVDAFQSSPLPVPVIIACVSLIIGVLTGMSQGHVAIVMPIVAAMGSGNLDLAGVAMVFGVAGQMLTPTHFCLIVTMNYFGSSLLGTLRPILICELIILSIFSAFTFLTWG